MGRQCPTCLAEKVLLWKRVVFWPGFVVLDSLMAWWWDADGLEAHAAT